jgi:hypothetical protein
VPLPRRCLHNRKMPHGSAPSPAANGVRSKKAGNLSPTFVKSGTRYLIATKTIAPTSPPRPKPQTSANKAVGLLAGGRRYSLKKHSRTTQAPTNGKNRWPPPRFNSTDAQNEHTRSEATAIEPAATHRPGERLILCSGFIYYAQLVGLIGLDARSSVSMGFLCLKS